LWLATNYLPSAPPDDQAFWDRVRQFPCNASVDANTKRIDEYEWLQQEAEGFLALLVREAVAYCNEGLIRSEVATKATEQWRSESDTFAAFVDWLDSPIDYLSIHTVRSLFRDVYKENARNEGWPSLGERDFAKAMQRNGFGTVEDKRGTHYIWP
jgi:phage/plasmid-associated DNA primase